MKKNNPNFRGGYRQHKEDVFIKKIEKIEKSDEEGFKGGPADWFSDEEFYKNLIASMDHEGKKDYYFNSYSSFYIHEEMIKDRVI
jgi:protein associated with RNAse G/E